jgi:predicted Fe-Mo cluster-binding NifX family protein
MKVLITVWNGRISPVFDVAKEGLLINVENGEVVSKSSVSIVYGTCMNKVDFMISENIDVLICGAVSRRVEMELIDKGVLVYSFVSGDIDEVITGFIHNRLTNAGFAMPGCQKGRRCRIYNTRNMEHKKMKIAVTTTGKDLNSPFESRFGRAPGFIIYDTETKEFQAVDNSMNLNAAQGAGIQAAMNIVKSGAKALISGHCGPKAFTVLNQAGVEIFNTNAATVSEAVEQYVSGKLQPMKSADVDGHW